MRGERAMSRIFRGIRASLSRREFVRLSGASLAGAALLGVAGCRGEENTVAARHGPTEGWIGALTGNDVAVGHVVLLGDSIFDNAAYVAGAPDVVQQVRQRLPSGSRATLAAVDGSRIGDVQRQLRRVPEDATHLVLSVGGNDALGRSDFLEAPARSTAEALSGLSDIADEFERAYLAMLADVLARRLPTAICTIYYPRFPDAALQKVAVAALTVFNDSIIRAAFAHGLPLLDLRLICSEETDYANPIEPSARGGEKIARAIVEYVESDPLEGRTEVFT
jgi:lysophospholipase L1-like esterase